MVDQALLLRKLSLLDEYLEQLQEFASVSLDQYRGDWKTQRIVERTLQMLIELCVDTATHIISDRKLRIPMSYSDAFKVLHENKLIDDDLHTVLDKMAKFRNIVVHHYDKVDETIVVTILRKHLGDFQLFREAILAILRGEC